MNGSPKFLVLTSSDISAATVIHYILKTTNVRIAKIYVDSGYGSHRPQRTQDRRALRSELRGGEWLRCHLGLAPHDRHYAFKVFERLTGMGELPFLYLCERVHPFLLRIACGFHWPSSLRIRSVLRSLTDVSREFEIPLVQTTNLNDPKTIANIVKDQPDVLIGLGTRILSRKLLEVPRIGTLNAHSSLLPNYRGGTTEFWQLAAGEVETGVTIHWMSPRVDEGEICAQAHWPIPLRTDHHRLRLMSLFYRLELWRARSLTISSTSESPKPSRIPLELRPIDTPAFGNSMSIIVRMYGK